MATTPDAATIAKQLKRMTRQLAELDAALAEIERVKAAGETVPKHIPLTDPQARVTPNKDGGFAPNYTPLLTVEVASGMIVGCEVIAMTNEEHHLVAQVEAVQRDFGLKEPVSEVLADTETQRAGRRQPPESSTRSVGVAHRPRHERSGEPSGSRRTLARTC